MQGVALARYVYEKRLIQKHLDSAGKCPVTKEDLTKDCSRMIPNSSMADAPLSKANGNTVEGATLSSRPLKHGVCTLPLAAIVQLDEFSFYTLGFWSFDIHKGKPLFDAFGSDANLESCHTLRGSCFSQACPVSFTSITLFHSRSVDVRVAAKDDLVDMK
eukprot:2348487-Amphidinium_carterae.2